MADGPDSTADADELDADLDTDPDPVTAHRAAEAGAASRSTSRWNRRTAGAVGLAAIAVLVFTQVVRHLGADDAREDDTISQSASSAEGLFSVLSRPPGTGSAFPDSPLTRGLAVTRGSTRLLATTPTAAFWLARDDRGGVCLLARDTTDEEGLGGTCATIADVAARGIRLPAGEGVGALLVPDHFDEGAAAAAAAQGYVELVPNLWVDSGTARDVVTAAVDAAVPGQTVVATQSHRGDSALPGFAGEGERDYAAVLACLRPAELRVTSGDGEPVRVPCGPDVVTLPLAGTRGTTRVVVAADDALLWAVAVIECTRRCPPATRQTS